MPPLKPEISSEDLQCAESIRVWLEGRQSNRAAWKKLSNLAGAFGAKRLTQDLKHRMTVALEAKGIALYTSLDDLGRDDTVVLHFAPQKRRRLRAQSPNRTTSDQLPDQIIAWHQHNIAEASSDRNDDDGGQFLRCLKSTPSGGRQFIWEGSSGRGIVGIVTFGGCPRQRRNVHEHWGLFELFSSPLSREQLLAHPATRGRFDGRGIRGLQGSPIRLTEIEARAISEMVGGLKPTKLPTGVPDKRLPIWKPIPLPPEKFTEEVIHANAHLWRALGLKGQPRRQKGMGRSGRVDLIWENTIVEVKKAVITNNGPDQIEGYLEDLARELGVRNGKVRGLLVQQEENIPPGVRDRLTRSKFPLELWAVRKNGKGIWNALRLI